MSFKFSLISDMHVDFPQPKTPYDLLEEHVVVAGDTSNGLGGVKFLKKLENKGHKVFAVDGNHEHYANLSQDRPLYETQAQFHRLREQPAVVDLPNGLRLIGCNGWYPVSDESLWQAYMSDSRLIDLTAKEANYFALLHADFVECRLVEHDGRSIVVTHTAPCLDTLNPAYDGHYSNEWYWNPHMLEVLRVHSNKIAVWCHGHAHAPADKIVDGVRVVCNPRGYPGENPNWKPLTIEIS